MTLMKDTEGEKIPKCEGRDLFNLTLWNDGKMSMRVPAFATDSGEYTARYGVLEVPLREIFNEFLANDDNLIKRPDEPIAVANLLHEYAAKFDAFSTSVALAEPPQPPTAEDIQALIFAASKGGQK